MGCASSIDTQPQSHLTAGKKYHHHEQRTPQPSSPRSGLAIDTQAGALLASPSWSFGVCTEDRELHRGYDDDDDDVCDHHRQPQSDVWFRHHQDDLNSTSTHRTFPSRFLASPSAVPPLAGTSPLVQESPTAAAVSGGQCGVGFGDVSGVWTPAVTPGSVTPRLLPCRTDGDTPSQMIMAAGETPSVSPGARGVMTLSPQCQPYAALHGGDVQLPGFVTKPHSHPDNHTPCGPGGRSRLPHVPCLDSGDVGETGRDERKELVRLALEVHNNNSSDSASNGHETAEPGSITCALREVKAALMAKVHGIDGSVPECLVRAPQDEVDASVDRVNAWLRGADCPIRGGAAGRSAAGPTAKASSSALTNTSGYRTGTSPISTINHHTPIHHRGSVMLVPGFDSSLSMLPTPMTGGTDTASNGEISFYMARSVDSISEHMPTVQLCAELLATNERLIVVRQRRQLLDAAAAAGGARAPA